MTRDSPGPILPSMGKRITNIEMAQAMADPRVKYCMSSLTTGELDPVE